jgi:tetratricopeptide (TPR) repeat protein
MDSVEKLRILEGAQGHPGQLALATVDLALGHLKEEERATLKVALKAAAVPHWVDEHILATLLSIEQEEALRLLAGLRNLNVVEPFPARGERAANVHEATRKALRKMLLQEHPELFRSLSARAREWFAGETAFHMRIEALYHLFAADQDAAAIECARLDNEATVLAGPQTWLALATMLSELLDEEWLTGRALLEALLSVHERLISRSETKGVEAAAKVALGLAKQVNDLRGEARAYGLIAFIRESESNLDLALDALNLSVDLFKQLVSESPSNFDWLRELATVHSKLGDIFFQKENFPQAIDSFGESLQICDLLISKNPGNLGWQREAAVVQSKLGDILLIAGLFDDATRTFRRAIEIFEDITARDPSNTNWQRELAVVHTKLGHVSFLQECFEDALKAYEHTVAISEKVIGSDPTDVLVQLELVLGKINVGTALAKLGRRDEATAILREAQEYIRHEVDAALAGARWTEYLQGIEEILQTLEPSEPQAGRDAEST